MNRRTLGFMLAAMLLLSGGGMTISANAENRFLIPSSATEQEAIAKVKEYFGWENYSGTVDTTNLRFLYVSCDNEKKYFLLGKSQETKPKKLFDPITFEDVFVYEGELTDNQDLVPTTYFTHGEQFENFGSYDFTFSEFTEKEYYRNSRVDLPIDEYAKVILKVNPDLNLWYSKNNPQPSLEELDYLDIIPNVNDDKLILKNSILVTEGYEGKPPTQRFPMVITERQKVSDERWEYYDIFSGELVGIEGKGSRLPKYETTRNANKKIWAAEAGIGLLTWGTGSNVHLTRALRECTEVIDGVEYMRVGKLRKVYENLRPDRQLDYSMYFGAKDEAGQ